MIKMIFTLLQKAGLGDFAYIIAYAVCIVAMVIVCIVSRWLIRRLMLKIFAKITERVKISWIEILLNNNLFIRLSNLVIPITVSFFTDDISGENTFLNKVVEISLIVIILHVLDSCVKTVGTIYGAQEVAKTFPIRGLLQVIKIAMFIIGGIVIISIFVNKSPAALLGSIGAMTAITSILFKDAILGFIAGIQLTGNDMIRIDDWIELPKHSANGTVIDLSMTTVKVENFDKTITLIPAYILVSEAFINWRGMVNTGARRIKRSIFIDAVGVRICDGVMLDKFRNTALLKEYINNSLVDAGQPEKLSGGGITNIGVFRAYITEYLKRHRSIHKNLALIVRQLESGETGIPLEIYAFTNTTVWEEYENIQADIFDHLYAVIPEFGLKIYQNPSSDDMRRISRSYQNYTDID